MTDTEITLLAVHRSPMVPLADICRQYFGVGITEARRKASLNLLPVPCWRLVESQKAPLMVRLTDLAAFIDSSSAEAREAWTKSQI